MNDITALAQRMKAAAQKATPGIWEMEQENIWFFQDGYTKHLMYVTQGDDVDDQQDHINTQYIAEVSPANVLALVEALEKAQQSVELVDLQRDKIKRLESDLWDKEQLRKVHSEKSFELEGKVRELEARNQKDFVWRGKEISRLNDEIDELKEKLESRTVTVKLPAACADDEYFNDGVFQPMRYERDVERALRAAGIQVIEGEG